MFAYKDLTYTYLSLRLSPPTIKVELFYHLHYIALLIIITYRLF
jgi:hypothetical protein